MIRGLLIFRGAPDYQRPLTVGRAPEYQRAPDAQRTHDAQRDPDMHRVPDSWEGP